MKTGEDEEGYIFTNKILAGFEWNISRTAMYNHKYIQRLVVYIYFYIIYFFLLIKPILEGESALHWSLVHFSVIP